MNQNMIPPAHKEATMARLYHTSDPLEDLNLIKICFRAVGDLLEPAAMNEEAKSRIAVLMMVLSDLHEDALHRAFARRREDSSTNKPSRE